jgi:hypothetical protein
MSKISGMPPTDTPPDKAIPVPKPSPPPSLQTLRNWLPLYLNNADKAVDHLSRILSTPSGTDALLLTLCYTSLLTSTVLSSVSTHRLHKTVRNIIEKAISLPPNTTVIIDTATIPTSRLLVTAKRLNALSSLISDFRIFARLWGLIGIWKWGKGVFVDNKESDIIVRRIAELQVIVNIFYQYLENGAYLSSKGIMGWNTEKQNKAWVCSSRFWMAHVGLDFIRLAREYVQRKNRGTEEEKRTDGPHGDLITDAGDKEFWNTWKRQMVVNLAYAPLTVHWSLEKGLVGDFWVGLLGSVAGVAGFRELWKTTR